MVFKGDPRFMKLGPKRSRDLSRMLKEVIDLNDGKVPLMKYKDYAQRKRR